MSVFNTLRLFFINTAIPLSKKISSFEYCTFPLTSNEIYHLSNSTSCNVHKVNTLFKSNLPSFVFQGLI